MSSYFDFRLQRAHSLIKAMLPMALIVLFWLSSLRVALYFFYYSNQVGFSLSLLEAFFAGARFDVLILGFAAIPMVLIVWAYALGWSPWKLRWFVSSYFFLVVMICAVLAVFDAAWVAQYHERINHRFDLEWLGQLSTTFEQISMGSLLAFTVLVVLLTAIVLKILSRQSAKKWSELVLMAELNRVPPMRHTLRFVWTLMWVALAARGTLTPHHLNAEHAEISADVVLNQLPVNPVWNLDK